MSPRVEGGVRRDVSRVGAAGRGAAAAPQGLPGNRVRAEPPS